MKPQTYQLNANSPERSQVLANAHAFLDRLPADKGWRIEIRPYSAKRTLKQNATMWGLAYDLIMESTGLEGEFERKQLHRDFCGDFFGWVDGPMGKRRPRRTTTKNEQGEADAIDTAEMARFFDFIQRKAAEFGIDVPDPDPMWSQRGRFAA